MYTKILVPLDGSELAECALPHLEKLASGNSEAEIILISVTELVKFGQIFYDPHVTSVDSMVDGAMVGYTPSPNTPGSFSAVEDAIGRMETEAHKYLTRVAEGFDKKVNKPKVMVLRGTPAQEIVNYAEKSQCDIIVMASHGRSGPSRWALGSIADKVFRRCSVPVLMVRGPGCEHGSK
ncbi:MAG: universal stress protein [Deltaproteobacteria bacterium]|nr:universal stress protein [Deltaproteobacteria bacterium]MBW1915538.1 universal stress protein [Deltaproteobacteria bacterium]